VSLPARAPGREQHRSLTIANPHTPWIMLVLACMAHSRYLLYGLYDTSSPISEAEMLTKCNGIYEIDITT